MCVSWLSLQSTLLTVDTVHVHSIDEETVASAAMASGIQCAMHYSPILSVFYITIPTFSNAKKASIYPGLHSPLSLTDASEGRVRFHSLKRDMDQESFPEASVANVLQFTARVPSGVGSSQSQATSISSFPNFPSQTNLLQWINFIPIYWTESSLHKQINRQ